MIPGIKLEDVVLLLEETGPKLDKVTQEDAGSIVLLEIGAGAGNTAFPVLANNKNPKAEDPCLRLFKASSESYAIA